LYCLHGKIYLQVLMIYELILMIFEYYLMANNQVQLFQIYSLLVLEAII
jgi:hypothetical protein